MDNWAGVDKFKTGFSVDEHRFTKEIEDFESVLKQLSSSGDYDMGGWDGWDFKRKIGCRMEWNLSLKRERRKVRGWNKYWIVLVAEIDTASKLEYEKKALVTLEVEKAEGCSVAEKCSSETFTIDDGTMPMLKLRLFPCAKKRTVQKMCDICLLSTCNRNDEKHENLKKTEKELFLKRIANLYSDDDKHVKYDVTFQVGDSGAQVGAHRAILAARSPVFAQMCQSKTSEATIENVQIEDLSKQALEVVIHFVYRGSLKEDWGDVVGEVAYAAKKYELNGLTEFVNDRMIELCTKDNAEKLLDIATTYCSLNKAKSDIEEFLGH